MDFLKTKNYKLRTNAGQLLLEVLVAIAIGAVVLGIGGNLAYVSLHSNKASDEKDTALALANETMEATQAVAMENWQTLYTTTAHNSNYYPSRVSDSGRSYKWIKHTPPDSTTRWGNQSVNAVSALPSGVWIAANNSLTYKSIWRYNGVWTDMSPSLSNDFYAIEALSNNEVWAGGQTGVLRMWNGASWVDWAELTMCNSSTDIRSISASSSSNVWVVGVSGKVWKADSVASTCSLIGGVGAPTADLFGVSALDSTNIWMVGPSGKVYSYNGTAWDEHSDDTGAGANWNNIIMNSVSVVSATNVWIAGGSGNVWNYNGSLWCDRNLTNGVCDTTAVPNDWSVGNWDNTNIKGITAFSSSRVVIEGASGEVWEYDGSTWGRHHSGSGCELNDLCDAQVTGAFLGGSNKYSNEWWVVGEAGNVWQYQPTKWEFTSGTEAVALGTNTFTRSFIVQNVCRDKTTNNITVITTSSGVDTVCLSGSDYNDQSTQKITVTVSWTGGQTITTSNYISRWKNAACLQTKWASTDTSTTVYFCPNTVYKSADVTIDLTTNTQVKILTPTVNVAGVLTSAIFDTTGISSRGSSYNSIMWKGNALTGTQKVQFQIGVYDTDIPSGTLHYYSSSGSGCNTDSATVWFDPGAKDTPIDLKDCASNLNNKRYFVYKMRLCGNSSCSGLGSGTTPTVTDVIINTSP